MIGVVLWSDAALKKSVIWCDDQGDLAFCMQDCLANNVKLHAGDWVEFDLVLEGSLRLAMNPRPTGRQASRGLARQVASAAEDASELRAVELHGRPVPRKPASGNSSGGKILPFPCGAPAALGGPLPRRSQSSV